MPQCRTICGVLSLFVAGIPGLGLKLAKLQAVLNQKAIFYNTSFSIGVVHGATGARCVIEWLCA